MARVMVGSFWRRFAANSIGRIRVGRRVPTTGTTGAGGTFEGIKGFGTQTTGGAGGRSYQVTNLNDEGPGSLREAFLYDGPQVITFTVGGIIWNLSPLKIRHPFVTIDGSTAPSPIVLKGEEFRIRSHDILIAHIRIRTGDVLPCEDGFDDRDAANVGDAGSDGEVYNVVLFHCSLFWSVDECLTADRAHDFTYQNCIVTEALYHSEHPKTKLDGTPHSMSMLFRSSAGNRPCYNGSIHGNLISNGNQRNPQFTVCTNMDYRNNLCYNWGEEPLALEGGGLKVVNVVANYYKPGPNTVFPPVGNPTSWFRVANSAVGAKVFIQGNTGPLDGDFITDPNFNNWLFLRLDSGITPPDTPDHHLAAPFDCPAIDQLSAAQTYQYVLDNAGATLPYRDAHDLRVLAQVVNNTGAFIDSPTDVGGW